jgi:ribosomal protein L14E/L6E/L27E
MVVVVVAGRRAGGGFIIGERETERETLRIGEAECA